MSSAPNDLLSLRHSIMAETGLTDPVEVGIVADQDHLESGGYHCGCGDINSIGKYNNTDPSDRDYSVRQSRDRIGSGTNVASAMDISLSWPRGGRSAALRCNLLLRQQLGARDPALVAVRAINYLNGNGQKRRFDTFTGTESSSTDTVDIHLHIEWWRDTVNTASRAASVARIVEIAKAARDNRSLTVAAAPAAHREDSDMLYQVTGVPAAPNNKDIAGAVVPEFGVMQATPDGPLNVDASEWGSISATTPTLMRCTWPRLLVRCAALAPAPINVEQLAQEIADATPDDEVTQQTILDAIAQPAAVQVFRDAAEYAQDH